MKCARNLQTIGFEQPYCFSNGLLLFRGTLSWRELISESRIGKRVWEDGGTVHKGFGDMYSDMRSDLLKNALETRGITTVAGHSLGGVFAVLCARDMMRMGVKPLVVYTFGAPRMGDKQFVESVRSLQIYRVANSEDIVTRLPPLCRHVGKLVRVNFDQGSIIDNHGLTGYMNVMQTRWKC